MTAKRAVVLLPVILILAAIVLLIVVRLVPAMTSVAGVLGGLTGWFV